MIKSYLTLTFRSLRKRKLYTVINVSGLALGIAVFLVIWRYVNFELSYDRFHQKADDIYRLTFTEYGKDFKDDWFTEFGYGLGPALITEIPEIKNYVRLHPLYGNAAIVSVDAPKDSPAIFQERDILFADRAFLDVFTFEAILGNTSTALDRPSSVVITESLATKYFSAHVDPIGRTLHIKTKDLCDGDYTITAVLKEVPQNGQLQFKMLLSMRNLLQSEYYRQPGTAWEAMDFTTYVELASSTDPKSLDEKTKRFMDKQTGTDPLGVKLSYQPLPQVNLSPDLNDADSHKQMLYFFVLISVFILSIAWINYINLSTARATERAKEVGVKKAMGVMRGQLITQFIVESLLINFLSIVFALGLAVFMLPLLGNIVNKNIAFDFYDPMLWVMLTALFIAGSFISGAYPAFVLSSYKTTEVIKGKLSKVGYGLIFRKALVVFQFTASLLLITGTFIIYRQVDFMLTRDKGLVMNQVLIVNGPQIIGEQGSGERMISFKNELLKRSTVKSVTSSGAIPGGGFSFTTGVQVASKENSTDVRETIHVVWVDTDFIQAYGIQILSGRTWNPNRASDMNAVFINEATLERLGLGTAEEALNEKLIIGDGEPFVIQGVLKNFHWSSLQHSYEPILFRPQQANYNMFSIQLHFNTHESVELVEHIYKEHFPGNPFDYYFLDDYFNLQYQREKQFGSIFSMFSILAIGIACLGLWGLASFTTIQRLKEISIRKVLGATVGSIISLLSAQFLKLLCIASLLALPVTWFAATAWVSNFAFRIGITPDLFLVPFFALLIIALITIILQIFRGATVNPADVLRSE